MENCPYPDSRDSSPRSREIDCDTPSWDDQPPSSASSYKVKFMCSYGGKIQPRPHDHQLAYVGGDTKILTVDRNIKLSAFISKLSSLCDTSNDDVCFKYQLPGEDLDALISVTNDEDLDHMMIEYDRLYRASAKPARLRLFLFPFGTNPSASFGSSETKSERQWFVDALNSVQIGSPDGSSPTAPVTSSPTNPDFLFGFDKGYKAVPVPKFPDSVTPPTVPDSLVKSTLVGSEDRHTGEPVISPAEIQRQIQELQRLQIAANHEPTTIYHRKSDEMGNPRGYNGDYYTQKLPDNIQPAQGSSPVAMPPPMQFSTAYMPERHMNTGGYPVTAAPSGPEQPVYLISTPTGVYQAPAPRPATGTVGQAYYGVPQRMAPEAYRDAQVYNNAVAAQQAQQIQQAQQGQQAQQAHQAQQAQQAQQALQAQQAQQALQAQQAQQAQQVQQALQAQQTQQALQAQQAQQAKIAAYSEGFAPVGYDAVGRQVYYTAAGGVVSSYQTVAPVAVDARQAAAGALNQIQDGKVVVSMAPQASAN